MPSKPLLKALWWAKVWVDIHNEGVTDALVLTYLNLASSIVCQKQSNGNASQGVLYTALIGFELKMLVGRKGELYIYIYVGLSALLVSTDRAMREPREVERAKSGSTFFVLYDEFNNVNYQFGVVG